MPSPRPAGPVVTRRATVRAIPAEYVTSAVTDAEERIPARLRAYDPTAVLVAYRLAGERWDRVQADGSGSVVVR